MRFRLLLVMLALGVGAVLAQYKTVSIHDIQYVDSVGTKGWSPSTLTNDTVKVTGVIMIRPVISDTNRFPVMYYGTRWGTYIQDTSVAAVKEGWGGINVLQNDTTGDNQQTLFDIADTGSVVTITGVVTTYNETNELFLLLKPIQQVEYGKPLPKRPDPLVLTMSDLTSNKKVNKEYYKYSGTYVEFKDVIVSDVSSAGYFNINDDKGNQIEAYNQSRYYRTDNNKIPNYNYVPPVAGTHLSYIRGILTLYQDTYEILPIYPDDIHITLLAPSITNIKRDPVQVKTNDQVTISANVTGGSGSVDTVLLHYKIGDQDRVAVQMTKSISDTTLYTAVINGISTDSTVVDYYISAVSSIGLKNTNPGDTVKGNYFYQVLDEPLKIRDIQFSPLGSGFSSYNGYYVTLSGVVTADTSDIPGFSSTSTPPTPRIYMQDGSGPWTGIMIGTGGPNGADVLKFVRGDNVTLNGIIREISSVTAIDTLTSITVNSHNNQLPDVVDLKTGDIADSTGAVPDVEQWESVLIDYKNVKVTNENADGSPGPNAYNFGESFITDNSVDSLDNARIEFQDGNHNYNNDWDAALADNPANIYVKLNSTFTEIRGILFYSHSYYKIVPRKNDDFMGYMGPTAVNDETSKLPVAYKLDQNYPNPFNPSTTINFSIPKESIVTLKIYNILGQEVRTLVNQNKRPGNYTIRFNASNLSSGIYFYSLKAGNYFQVKKMILLK